MDEALTKWNVTFTKHLKQKRKLYHDGFLSLHSSTAKISFVMVLKDRAPASELASMEDVDAANLTDTTDNEK